MRCATSPFLIGTCAGHGPSIGIYAGYLLNDPLPWTRMRAVYRLIGLVRRDGGPVETACTRSLDLERRIGVQDRGDTGESPRDPSSEAARLLGDPGASPRP